MARNLFVLVTTFPARPEAEKAARLLVEERLAVCAQVGDDIRSWYRWQGQVEQSPEVLLTLKVREDRREACAGRLQALHPYEIPEILAWPVAWAEPGYLAWAYGEGGA
jgi:periplasmic divalent cation tolerance protein